MPMIHIEAYEPENWHGNENWTDWLARRGGERGINRQCSIGYHEECSDPQGETCTCHCHPWGTVV